jgi:omega-amidase
VVSKVKIAILQVATLMGQPHKNRVRLESLLHEVISEDVDVAVFPETWNFGFFPDNIAEVAEDTKNSESLEWMKATAKKNKINIVGGSIAVKENGQLFNRSYILNRQGEEIYYYDKSHLFSPGKEPDYFTPGNQNKVFTLDGVPCAVQICYDLRFPELARKQALEGAEIIFVPAQWPHPRSSHWVALNKARAIENQVFIISNNGCGQAGNLTLCGHSNAFDPWGEELLLLGQKEGAHTVTLDLSKVQEARSKIPVLKDRRPEMY